jgi:hypothetical protein
MLNGAGFLRAVYKLENEGIEPGTVGDVTETGVMGR